MSSDLYYYNLGVSSPENYRNYVVSRLSDFEYYLYSAKRRMDGIKCQYHFTFKISPIWKVKDRNEEYDDGEVFQTKECIGKICGKIQNNELYFDITPSDEGCVYKRTSSGIQTIAYLRDSWELSGIKLTHSSGKYEIGEEQIAPVSEEVEEEALDLIFSSRWLYDYSKNSYRVLSANRYKKIIWLKEKPKSNQLFSKYDTSQLKKEIEAFHTLMMMPKPHNLPLLNLLQKKDYASWDDVFPPSERAITYEVLTDANRSGTLQQRRFVRKALGTNDFAILEGPPGSGKTTALCELIIQEIKLGHRVLMVASTHIAVDNILEKLDEFVPDTTMSYNDKYGIIPLRIGEEASVLDSMRKYCESQVVETEQKRILHYLSKIRNPSDAQKELYALIRNDVSNKGISKLLIDCANFVCGTMIGILRAPMIQEIQGSAPLFDVVIVDEASKTTFSEFIVPALYGRKFILSGDTRQLAPYTDEMPIKINVCGLIKHDEIRELCKAVFDSSVFSRGNRSNAENIGRYTFHSGKILICDDEQKYKEFEQKIKLQIEELNILCKNKKYDDPEICFASIPTRPLSVEKQCELAVCNLLLTTSDTLKDIADILPPALDIDKKTEKIISPATYIVHQRKQKAYKCLRENKSEPWEDAVTWRLNRQYELKGIGGERFDKLSRDLDLLLPKCIDAEIRENKSEIDMNKRIADNLDKIISISYPSILEFLQTGYQSRFTKKYSDVALYAGLGYDEKDKSPFYQKRHELLTFQHRMHPDISAFPRKYIYENTALEDANGISDERVFPFQRGPRVIWMHVSGTKTNESNRINNDEINLIVNNLSTLLEKINENNYGKHWSIALLSYYNGQVKQLAKSLKSIAKKYSLEGSSYQYLSKDVTIVISTVDRYQGHEADIVYLSFVRIMKGKKPDVGFIDNKNRLNVSLTRARYMLYLVGNKQNFGHKYAPQILKNLVAETKDGDKDY